MSLFRSPAPAQPVRTKTSWERAEELFWSKLTDAQRSTAKVTGSFDVVGSLGGRYRIYMSSTVINIAQMEKRCRTFCAGPARRMPDWDVWLCQKLLIESDEDEFLRVACSYY